MAIQNITPDKNQIAFAQVFIIVVILLACLTALILLFSIDTRGEKGSGLSPQFQYDTSTLKSDRNVPILYKESSPPITIQLTHPRAVALTFDHQIAIAGDQAVTLYSPQGRLLRKLTFDTEPYCLSTAEPNLWYIGFKDHIRVISPNGTLLARWQNLDSQAVLTALAVDLQNIYAADAGNRIIIRYNRAGTIINHIGAKDPNRNIPGFVLPSPYFDIALADDGLLRAVNPGRHRIEAYTPDGDLEFFWGQFSSKIEGFCGCCNPVNFAILPDEQGFITCEKGLPRVKQYDIEGNFLGLVAPVAQFTRHQNQRTGRGSNFHFGNLDVAVSPQNHIYILDPESRQVRIFIPKTAEESAIP
jgi:hypothetical protein